MTVFGQYQIPPVQLFENAVRNVGATYQTIMPFLSLPSDQSARPFRRLKVHRIYLPIAAWTQRATAPQPTKAFVGINAKMRGVTYWTYSSEIPLTVSQAAYATGNTIASADLVNPLELEFADVIELFATAAFDQTVDAWNVSIGYQVPDPTMPFTPTPGAVHFSYEIDD